MTINLSTKQNSNGSFKDSVFLTSLILLCLNKEDPNIKDNALAWLLSQKDENYMFDNDLGANFCALTAIAKHTPFFINGNALAKILKLLISKETNEGGPYANDKNNIDLGINSMIAYFLFLQDVDLPNLENFTSKCIKEKNFESKVFKNKYFVIYIISKFIKNESDKQALINYLINEKTSQNTLNSILILNSLIDLGYDKKALLEDIKSLENQDFNINSPLYINEMNEAIDSDPILASALYLELKRKIETKTNDTKKSFFDEEEQTAINEILDLAKQRFSNLPQEMKDIAFKRIKKTIKGNRDKQMSLMAYYTKKALLENGDAISDKIIAELGLSNIFFWTAFIIYDDFWDEDESQDPKILPTANLFARHYVNCFSSLFPKETGFNAFFHELMDKLDASNTWETINCRAEIKGSKFIIPDKLPDYGNYELKFYPSSGHMLGPLAIFYLLGHNNNSKETQNLISYFKNYLIAMQINDDAHDLEEDLKRGHISTVVSLLLNDLKEKYPNKKEIDLYDDFKEIQQIFWFKTIRKACKIAINHTKTSRKALKNITILKDCAPLEHYINITENVAKKALKEQKKIIDFLKTFG